MKKTSYLFLFFIFIIIMYLYQFINIKYLLSEGNHNNSTHSVIRQDVVLQVYVECNNNSFVPPIKSLPSYRIKCLSPENGYYCKETKAYLDFIIDNYENPLAKTYIFMHGHNKAWHYINPLTRTMQKLINSSYMRDEGFGGYQCYWNFIPTIDLNEKPTQELFELLFKSTTVEFHNIFNMSYPCCGTFFVKSEQIKRRRKSEYIQMIYNLKEWAKKDNNYKKRFGKTYDGYCARVYEMMWNRILSSTEYVKVPPYCKKEERMHLNPSINIHIYKRIYGSKNKNR